MKINILKKDFLYIRFYFIYFCFCCHILQITNYKFPILDVYPILIGSVLFFLLFINVVVLYILDNNKIVTSGEYKEISHIKENYYIVVNKIDKYQMSYYCFQVVKV